MPCQRSPAGPDLNHAFAARAALRLRPASSFGNPVQYRLAYEEMLSKLPPHASV
jgi:hypothetical protein